MAEEAQVMIEQLRQQLAAAEALIPRDDAPASTSAIAEIKNIKLPSFWQRDPVLWFAQVESQFHTNNVRADNTRYHTVVSALDCNVLQQVSDVIASPPANNKYETIKTRLIAAYSDSQERQIKKLLTEVELGDQKPSQLLREMRALADNRISEDVLRTLWTQRLPTHIQIVLSASDDMALEKMAGIADKVAEINYAQLMSAGTISAIHRPKTPPSADLMATLERLQTQITALSAKVDSIAAERGRQSQRSRSRNRSHSKGLSTQANRDICFYHRRFGEKATKCTIPCSYAKENPGN